MCRLDNRRGNSWIAWVDRCSMRRIHRSDHNYTLAGLRGISLKSIREPLLSFLNDRIGFGSVEHKPHSHGPARLRCRALRRIEPSHKSTLGTGGLPCRREWITGKRRDERFGLGYFFEWTYRDRYR